MITDYLPVLHRPLPPPESAILEKIYSVLDELQSMQSPSKSHLLALLKLCSFDNKSFLSSLEQGYLHIFSFMSSTECPMPTHVFETLLQDFVHELISL